MLSTLPSELLLLIAYHLPLSDTVKWSSSSKTFRHNLAPLVYSTVVFGNGPESASIALNAAERYASLVRSLVFTCSIDIDVHEDYNFSSALGSLETKGEDASDSTTVDADGKDRILPAAAYTLFKGVHTPYASRLVVRFELEYWSLNHFDEPFEPMDSDFGGTLQAEAKFSSRALMARVWDAVADNEQITNLEIPTLMPKFVSTFETPKFERFFGGLFELDIKIFSTNKKEACVMGSSGYKEFFRNLAGLFFQHAKGLRRLRLECARDAPLGLGDDYFDDPNFDHSGNDDFSYMILPLPKALVMPELRSLEVRHCFICPELLTFIAKHQASLRSLHLDGIAHAEYYSVMTWARFFTKLANLNTQLSKLMVNPWNGDPFGDLASVPDELFFTCGNLSDSDGSIRLDEFFAGDRSRQDDDMRAYVQLKTLVESNKARQECL